MAPLVPMVLIHGGGGAGQLWQNQLLAFPHAIAPDLPGHPEGPGLSTVADMAGWVLRLIDERGIGPCVIGGHSLGGGVALQAGLDAPERLRGLILVGTGSRLHVRPEFFEQLRGVRLARFDPDALRAPSGLIPETAPVGFLDDRGSRPAPSRG